jgi:hypothetical protein
MSPSPPAKFPPVASIRFFREILLVTFAAYKVKLLTEALNSAIRRNVSVRLVLEFEETSLNQLSMDALKAFPPDLIAQLGEHLLCNKQMLTR